MKIFCHHSEKVFSSKRKNFFKGTKGIEKRSLLPTFNVAAQILGHLLLVEGGVDASLFLGNVVAQQPECLAREEYDGNEIANGHQSHGDIGKTPCKVEAHHGTTHHHTTYEHAIEPQVDGAAADEADVGLAIIVVADDATEGKEQNGNGYKD